MSWCHHVHSATMWQPFLLLLLLLLLPLIRYKMVATTTARIVHDMLVWLLCPRNILSFLGRVDTIIVSVRYIGGL